VPPRRLAAAFRHRRDPRIFLEFGGRGIAFPLFAKGYQEAGSEDGPLAFARLLQDASYIVCQHDVTITPGGWLCHHE
jgi:hypothetical protein